jgi:hypothetical protein
MEDMCDIKRVLERQGNTHNKVEIQSNSELWNLTSSPTQRPGSPYLQIDTQDVADLRFWCSTYEWKDKKITLPMTLVS